MFKPLAPMDTASMIVDPTELVLEYLASKGFTSAESALRQQLDTEPAPLPPGEASFSALWASGARTQCTQGAGPCVSALPAYPLLTTGARAHMITQGGHAHPWCKRERRTPRRQRVGASGGTLRGRHGRCWRRTKQDVQ